MLVADVNDGMWMLSCESEARRCTRPLWAGLNGSPTSSLLSAISSFSEGFNAFKQPRRDAVEYRDTEKEKRKAMTREVRLQVHNKRRISIILRLS